MTEQRTTQDLRTILFDSIEKVRDGAMTTTEAGAVSKLATNIINTAELEIKYSQAVSRLDKDDQGISPGPLLLTDRSAGEAA